MTRKQQAKELVERFKDNIDKHWVHEIYMKKFAINQAKQCALICVDEKIKQLNKIVKWWNIENGEWYKDELQELQELIKEIEKL